MAMAAAASHTHIGFLGYGEIGSSVAKLYEGKDVSLFKRDVFQGLAEDFSLVTCVHIAIPFINQDQFMHFGSGSAKAPGVIPTLSDCHKSAQLLLVIHSTTPPGALAKVATALAEEEPELAKRTHIVHAPVRGKHPHLEHGLRNFTNYLGGATPGAGEAALAHLQQLGIPLKVFDSSTTTEVAKILSTTYFGVCVAWCQEMKEMCQHWGVPYEEAVVEWNESINKGYVNDGRGYFQRPILKTLQMPIGGHCVGPNARLLSQVYPDALGVKLVQKYSEAKAHVTAGKSEADMAAVGIGVASGSGGAASADIARQLPPAFAHETAIVDAGAKLGAGTKVWHWAHVMGSAAVGTECVLGQNVFIGADVVIGDKVKIQNNVSVYSGVTVEDEVFLGPSCVLTNDFMPRATPAGGAWKVSPTLLKRGASVGANATIVCGHTLGEWCMVGAGSVVTKDVKAYALVVGNPAKQVGWVSAAGEKLDLPLRAKTAVTAKCARTGLAYTLLPTGAVECAGTSAAE